MYGTPLSIAAVAFVLASSAPWIVRALLATVENRVRRRTAVALRDALADPSSLPALASAQQGRGP